MARTSLGSLVLAFVVVVFTACGGDKSTPKPKGNEPAGQVIELTGNVVASHADTKRPLKVGDKVMANETIITSDNSSVAIKLFHNEARWELGANKSRPVHKSLAWNAPKGSTTTGAKPTDKTMAAGRHAERQAGTTTPVRGAETTADKTADTETPEKVVAPPTAEPPKPAPSKQPPTSAMKTTPTPAPKTVVRRRKARKKARAKKTSARRYRKKTTGSDSINELLRKAGGRKGASSAGKRGGGTGGGALRNRGGIGDIGGAGGGPKVSPRPPPPPTGKKGKARARVYIGPTVRTTGGVSRAMVAHQFRRRSKLLRACYEQGLRINPRLEGTLKITVHFTEAGKVSRVTMNPSPLAKAIGRCLNSRLRRIVFPAQKPGASATQIVRFKR